MPYPKASERSKLELGSSTCRPEVIRYWMTELGCTVALRLSFGSRWRRGAEPRRRTEAPREVVRDLSVSTRRVTALFGVRRDAWGRWLRVQFLF
jgi:hypothetical protein